MTEEMMELGRRAVACKGWLLLPGTLCRWRCGDGWWSARLNDNHGFEVVDDTGWDGRAPSGGPIPALSDPATLGCLLALVREAWGEMVWVWPDREECGAWEWTLYGGLGIGGFSSEAEALVAALEAADDSKRMDGGVA